MNRIIRIAPLISGIFICIALFIANCSPDVPSSYEELEREGRVESFAREMHKDFFAALQNYETAYSAPEISPVDSTLRIALSAQTDILIEEIDRFPATVESRIALDALSYGAKELTESPGMTNTDISMFWEYGLMYPLFTFAVDYANSGEVNDSAHLQLIKALRRGMGSNATDQMVVDCIAIVGVKPSDEVMAYCETDSLVFKKVHDLVIYSRSLQKTDPPSWMLSGDWFLSIEFDGLPTLFIALRPDMIDDVPYLAFKDFTQGEVYAAVFEDPVPENKDKWEAWLARADAVMRNAEFDGSIAERVRTSGLSTNDAHNFYSDYLFHTEADTTGNAFHMSLVRQKDQISAFEFAGMDSITIIMSASDFHDQETNVREMTVTRIIGASMTENGYIPRKNFLGRAFMMPLGAHDQNRVVEYQESKQPEIDISVN